MTPHQILGVSENATKEEIKKAYKSLSFKIHPDRPGGDNEKYIEVKKAYEELTGKKVDPIDREIETSASRHLMQAIQDMVSCQTVMRSYYNDYGNKDLIIKVSETLTRKIRNLEKANGKVNAEISQIIKLKGAYKTKDNNNLVDDLIDFLLDKADKAIEHNNREIEILNGVSDIINNYSRVNDDQNAEPLQLR